MLASLAPDHPAIPVLQANATAVVPDPVLHSEWFERASERDRRTFAGAGRYAAAKQRLGRPPTWAELIDPETGDFVPVEDLKVETTAERRARVRQVQQQINERNRQTVQVATYGFLPPAPVPAQRKQRGVTYARGEPLTGLQPDPNRTKPDETGLQPDPNRTKPDETGLQPDETGLQPDETGLQPDPRHADDLLRAFVAGQQTADHPNFISLVDLRRQAGHLTRAQFDAALLRLRREGVLTLSPAEGRHGITREEQHAAIPGDVPGQLLLYVSLRPGMEERVRQAFGG